MTDVVAITEKDVKKVIVVANMATVVKAINSVIHIVNLNMAIATFKLEKILKNRLL